MGGIIIPYCEAVFFPSPPQKTTQLGQPNGCGMVGVQFSSPTRRVADLAVGGQARVRKLP